jgi:hypothetical protein
MIRWLDLDARTDKHAFTPLHAAGAR